MRTIIIEGMDRLAREYRIQETLIIYLASKGIKLVSARTEEDVTEAVMSDPMRKALVQIQGVFAELEKNLLTKKLRSARERKRVATGKCEGRKGYGEEMPEVVKEIKRLRRARKGMPRRTYGAIANELNEQGAGFHVPRNCLAVHRHGNGGHWYSSPNCQGLAGLERSPPGAVLLTACLSLYKQFHGHYLSRQDGNA